ncbi:hypothetical protein Tco_0593477, partial [Tanacetum coccineum]
MSIPQSPNNQYKIIDQGLGSTSGIRACALRNFDLEDIIKKNSILTRKRWRFQTQRASPTFRGSNTQSGGLWSGGLDSKRVPTITNIAVTNELGVVAYGVVDWTQRGVPTVTNIAVTNEDVGSSKGGNFDKASKDLDQLLESQTTDKSKKGLGYSAVTPPNPLVYNRPNKLDLSYSGLDEFKEPEFKGYGP